MTSQDLLRLIKERAIAKWGEDYWFAELVRAYVREENKATGKNLKPVQRRPQLIKLFDQIDEQERLTVKTSIYLLKAIGGELNVVFTNPEVIRLGAV